MRSLKVNTVTNRVIYGLVTLLLLLSSFAFFNSVGFDQNFSQTASAQSTSPWQSPEDCTFRQVSNTSTGSSDIIMRCPSTSDPRVDFVEYTFRNRANSTVWENNAVGTIQYDTTRRIYTFSYNSGETQQGPLGGNSTDRQVAINLTSDGTTDGTGTEEGQSCEDIGGFSWMLCGLLKGVDSGAAFLDDVLQRLLYAPDKYQGKLKYSGRLGQYA
jgi:hypothetical protein